MSLPCLNVLARSSALVTLVLGVACTKQPHGDAAGATWVVTIPPLAGLVGAIAGDPDAVIALLPAGSSPHSYAPRPSEVAAVERARAVFYVAPSLDGWIVRFASTGESVLSMAPESELLPADPEHDEGEFDPHFWTDPTLFAGVAMPIAEAMAKYDPEHAADYRQRATAYIEELKALDAELAATLAPVRGRAVMLVHPSLSYFLRRYGIPVAGYVESSSGTKPSPQHLKHLIDTAREQGVRAVFSETQLPRQAVAAIAESLQLPLYELDPLGGVDGRDTYEALMRYNAAVVLEALE